MGYNLNKLKKQMGVGSASKVGYTGAQNPGDRPEGFKFNPEKFAFTPEEQFAYDAEKGEKEAQQLAYDERVKIEEGVAKADYDKKIAADEAAEKKAFFADYEAQLLAAETDQAAYDTYSDEYDRRLRSTPMYADKQYTAGMPGYDAPEYGGADDPAAVGGAYQTGEIAPMVVTLGLDGKEYGNPGSAYDANRGFLDNKFTEENDQRNRFYDTGNWYEEVLGTPAKNYLGDTDPYTRDTGTGTGTGTINANGVRSEDMGGGITRYYNADGTYGDVDTTKFSGQNFGGPGIGSFPMPDLSGLNRNIQPLDPFIDPYANLVEGEETPIIYDLGDFDASNLNLNEIKFKRGGSVRGYALGAQPIQEEIPEGEIIAFEEALEQESLDKQAVNAVNAVNAGPPVVEDPVKSLRGLSIGAAGPSTDRTSELLEMIRNPSARYGDDIAQGRSKIQEQELKIANTLASMQTNASAGPSESEKWFRIAAAFGKPTPTGNFFEGLGNVNEALADVAKERRVAKTAGDAIGLEAAQFSLGIIDKRLQSDLSLAADEREQLIQTQRLITEWQMDYDNRQAEREYDLASLSMTLEERAKRDVSEAGRIARDMGYELGSDDGNKFIRKYYADQEAVKILQLAALRKNANTLSNTDVKIREETVKTLDSATLVISNLEEALTYNDDALTNSFFDTVRKATEGIISTDSTAYKATQNLEQILAKNAISSLKALFGGQLSDGERQASLDLEGLSSASKDVRRDIIQRALDTMRIVENKLNNKVRKISSGKYSQIEE
jgi:hypothetical protein